PPQCVRCPPFCPSPPPTPPPIYTLSLHDALPISYRDCEGEDQEVAHQVPLQETGGGGYRRCWRPYPDASGHNGDTLAPTIGSLQDRKSTRLNSSHVSISYAVFCLKKKNEVTRSQL